MGQSHVLAWVLVAPLGVLGFAELRRSGRRAVPWLATAIAIVALSFSPFIVNELTSGFSELRALLEARGGVDDGPDLLVRAIFVPFRIATVPLVGDLLQNLVVSTTAAALVVGAAALASHRAMPFASTARVLALGLAVGMAGLVVGAPWLSTVTPLFVDHYHLALDPTVFTLLGLGAVPLWRHVAGRTVVAGVVGAFVAWNLLVVPLPPVNADGGWPAGLAAGERVVAETGADPLAIVGVPDFKKTTALDYPVTILGHAPVDPSQATRVSVLCDELFEEIVGLACRGPAEAARLVEVGIPEGPLLLRFEAAPGRWISVYEVAGR